MSKLSSAVAGFAVACVMLGTDAVAGLTVYNSVADLRGQGLLSGPYDFGQEALKSLTLDVAFNDKVYDVNPGFTLGDATFTGQGNLVATPVALSTTQDVLVNAFNAPISATLAGGQDTLFGFSYAATGEHPDFTIELFTDKGDYFWSDEKAPALSGPFAFVGFQAPQGEHFIGFSFMATDPGKNGRPTTAGISNLYFNASQPKLTTNRIFDQSANDPVSPTPEPAQWVSMLIALFGIGGALRHWRGVRRGRNAGV